MVISDEDPRIIDWLGAVSGVAAADISRTLVVMTPAAASEVTEVTTEIERSVLQFAEIYRRRCMHATGVTDADLTAWRLPVIAARLADTIAGEEDHLRAEVERLTR